MYTLSDAYDNAEIGHWLFLAIRILEKENPLGSRHSDSPETPAVPLED